MISTVPLNDEREHELTTTCWCEPLVEWGDEDGPYPRGPMVIHNAADHREAPEELLGEIMAPDKQWGIFED